MLIREPKFSGSDNNVSLKQKQSFGFSLRLLEPNQFSIQRLTVFTKTFLSNVNVNITNDQ